MAPMSFRKGSKTDDGFIAQLAVTCERVLMATGLSQQVVNRAVVELVDQVRCHFGGWSIYIPKGRVTKEDRAAEVYARHSAGETIAELAGSYGFVPTYIAGLIALEARRLQEIRQKALASARKQGVENHHG